MANGGPSVPTQEKKVLRSPTALSLIGGLCLHKKKKSLKEHRIIGSFRKICEIFGFDGQYP